MIQKTAFCFLLLFAINYIFLGILRPDISVSQNIMQQNKTTAENFIYSDTITAQNIESIVVGSSLTSALNQKHFSKLKILSFAGGSPNDGLNLIINKGFYPKRIFIESNMSFKEDEKKFNDGVYDPILFSLRKQIPTLRDGKQPITILGSAFEKKVLAHIIPQNFAFGSASNSKEEEDTENSKIEKKRKEYTRDMSEDEKNMICVELKNKIDILRKNNTEVIFIEAPVDSIIQNSTLYKEVRQLLTENFPPEEFIYIPYPTDYNYLTTDGIHLDHHETNRYSLYLKNKIDGLSSTGI